MSQTEPLKDALTGAYSRADLDDRIKRQIGDYWGAAFTLEYLGQILHSQGQYAEARRHILESQSIRQSLNNQRGVGRCLQALDQIAQTLEELEEAAVFSGDHCSSLKQSVANLFYEIRMLRCIVEMA